MKHSKNIFFLVSCAVIWGFAFSFQKSGMDHLGPYAFNAIRNLVGAIFLIPCIAILDHFTSDNERKALQKASRKTLYLGGLCTGTALGLASTFQQIGLVHTSAGKCGFVTACYIIIVPILGTLFFRKKCSPLLWLATVLAVVALYLLCMTEALTIGRGDIYLIICAILYACHILVIDLFASRVDCVRLACQQFFVASFLGFFPMLYFEGIPTWASITGATTAILYTGIMSSGVAYTFQILGQRNFNPTAAAIIMSLESTFAVIGGWLILDEQLTLRQLSGCAIMFVALLLAQCPPRKDKTVK